MSSSSFLINDKEQTAKKSIPIDSGLTHLDKGAFTEKYPATVPEGCLFVMGDNRRNSLDSRSAEIGFVSEKDVIGKAVFRIMPFKRAGIIK